MFFYPLPLTLNVLRRKTNLLNYPSHYVLQQFFQKLEKDKSNRRHCRRPTTLVTGVDKTPGHPGVFAEIGHGLSPQTGVTKTEGCPNKLATLRYNAAQGLGQYRLPCRPTGSKRRSTVQTGVSYFFKSCSLMSWCWKNTTAEESQEMRIRNTVNL